MKDNSIICMAAIILGLYATYVFGSVAVGREPADGIVFGSILGALMLLAGVKYERKRIQDELIK